MVKSLALIFINIIIGSVGQLMFKSGMMQVGRIGVGEISRPLATLGLVFTNPYILLALPLYVVALILWLIVLSRLQLSFAYPFLSMAYVVNALLAQAILGEHISVLRWVAIGLICCGVMVITRTA
jgi:drug/metabolite transporter (DMT)-like permease